MAAARLLVSDAIGNLANLLRLRPNPHTSALWSMQEFCVAHCVYAYRFLLIIFILFSTVVCVF